jgi:hypothetical protein
MALTNLSQVTSTLITLLGERVSALYGSSVEVVPQSPDQIPSTALHTVSVYLYHAREDAHYKNAEPPAGKIANTPLALSLFYVVTAHHYDEDLKPVILIEQELMGYALKTLHDYPIITDTTQIGATLILHEGLRDADNHLQIIYRPVLPEDSVSFWNGDDERLIRFSAFYEVRVILVKPEAPTQLPGYVLSVGNYIMPTGVMHIASSHSVVRFTPPGGSSLALPASPARVALDTSAPPPTEDPNNLLTLRGTRLGGGRIVLRSPLFGTTGNQIVIDPASNPDWAITVTATRVTARVHGSVVVSGLPVPILPGTYGVSIQLSTTHELPGGLSKTLVSRSNEVAVAFTPFIVSHDPDPIVGDTLPVAVTLQTSDEVDLTEVALTDLSVVVAGQVYASTTDPPAVREFRVSDGNHIELGLHFTDTDLGAYPIRLIIRGAESPPFWIVIGP